MKTKCFSFVFITLLWLLFFIPVKTFAQLTKTVTGSMLSSAQAQVYKNGSQTTYSYGGTYSFGESNYTDVNEIVRSIWRFTTPTDIPVNSKITRVDFSYTADTYEQFVVTFIADCPSSPSYDQAYNLVGSGSNIDFYTGGGGQVKTSQMPDAFFTDVENVISASQSNIYIGILSLNEGMTVSPTTISQMSLKIYYNRPASFTLSNNFGSGVVELNGTNISSGSPSNTHENDAVTLNAVSPQIDNQGYQRVWNTSGVSQSLSSWQQIINNIQNFKTNNSQYSFTVAYSDGGTTYMANLMKKCNITFQNNFVGVGHGGVITVNGNQVNSPATNNMVVEQNAISAAATGTEINGIYYNLSNWTDANNNIISTNDSATFYPGSNMTYTANYIGSPASNTISMGYNIVVGQPITMHWTDNPNPNVTYQIWRNIKGGSGAELIATVGRGVQTYTDYGYIFTGTYTNDLLYYDVRQYYSVEGTYSNTNWQAVYGRIVPKAVVNNNLNQGENITNYFVGCYPNPFNPSTIINYQLPEAGLISLKIFDSMGREVKTLVNEQKDKGSYNISFDASHLSSGVYFYRLRAGNFNSTKKMILMK